MVAGVAALSALTLRSRRDEVGPGPGGYRDLIEHWRRVGAWTLQWTTLRNLIEMLAGRGEEVAAARLLRSSQSSPTASPTYGAEAARLAHAAVVLRAHPGDTSRPRWARDAGWETRGGAPGAEDSGLTSKRIASTWTSTLRNPARPLDWSDAQTCGA
jgi:hypothetical protein